MEDNPGEEAGGEVQRAALETVGDGDGGILRPGVHVLGGLGEIGGEVGDEVQDHGHGDKADDEGLQDVALRDGQDGREDVENARQGGQG